MKMIIDGVVSKGRRSSIQSYVQMITMSQRLWIIDESIDESAFRVKIEYGYPNFIQDQMMAISVFCLHGFQISWPFDVDRDRQISLEFDVYRRNN